MDPGDPNNWGKPTFPATFKENARNTEEDIWDKDLRQEEEMKVEVRYCFAGNCSYHSKYNAPFNNWKFVELFHFLLSTTKLQDAQAEKLTSFKANSLQANKFRS